MKENEFVCAHCGGIYPKDWSDEEAIAEFKELFPNVTIADVEVLCEICHAQFELWREAGRN